MVSKKRKGTYNAEHCVSLTTVSDSILDDAVFVCSLFAHSLLEIIHSSIGIAEVYLAETFIEQDFSRIEDKLEPQLSVVAKSRLGSATRYSVHQLRTGDMPKRTGRLPGAKAADL